MAKQYKCKISILIACYNSSRYIRRTLDSLLNQSMADIEIICIDDVSSDETLEIIEEYAKKDQRVIIVRNEVNSGQAVARNNGLKIASGEYITMIDSDDWFESDALEMICKEFEKSEDTDAVLYDLVYYNDDTNECYPYEMRNKNRTLTGRDAAFSSISWDIHGYYAIKNEIHKKYPFDDSSKLYSDDNTTHIHFLKSRIVRVSTGKYYYRQHNQSSTHKVSMLAFEWINAADSLRRSLLAEKADREIIVKQENERWKILIDRIVYFLRYSNSFSSQEKDSLLSLFREAFKRSDISVLYPEYKYKPGYFAFIRNFDLFMVQLKTYYLLKQVTGRS